MNWGKTVKKESEIEVLKIIYDAKKELEAQAEISYKAGEVAGYKRGLEMREPYLEGIRKVVGFVETHTHNIEEWTGWQEFKEENGL